MSSNGYAKPGEDPPPMPPAPPSTTCSLPPFFKPPFRHESGLILCRGTKEGDSIVLDVRGWGYLTGKGCGAHGMTDYAAISVQDQFGEWVAHALNESANGQSTGAA